MKYEYGYLVDNVWHCGCGSLNAATLTICPECKTPNPKNNE
jgi:hypothetical protein